MVSDYNNDSYELPEVPSDDEGVDSEDEMLESITRHVHDTGRKVDRDPAREPEAEAELPPLLTILYLRL